MKIPSSEELKLYYNKEDIIEATVQQLIKDFQWFDEDIALPSARLASYDELLEKLLPIVDRMLNIDTSTFFSLLYKIDLSEQRLKAVLFGGEFDDPTAEICKMIIERELLKVIVRTQYKSS